MRSLARTKFRRPALLGFGIGFVMAFVATMLALVSTIFEALHGLLVPAAALLRPFADSMADRNGLLNMSLAGLVNGVVYALVFVLGAATISAARARRTGAAR